MSDPLNILKNKANQLYSKLRSHGANPDRQRKLHLFANVVGERNWDNLTDRHQKKPKPYTSYQPCPRALQIAAGISQELAESILEELCWPSDYVPAFNTLPICEDGMVLLPSLFISSHLFSNRRKREKNCLLKRVALFDLDLNMDKDQILYTGEELNHYDKLNLLSLLYIHPVDIPVGHYYFVSQKEVESVLHRSISSTSLQSSLKRMRDCRIWIPKLNFFGPLIYNYRKIQGKPAYRIALNSEITKFYYEGLYSQFMDSGKLFRHHPNYNAASKDYDHRSAINSIGKLSESDFIMSSKRLGELWPTHDSDMAAIHAILFKHSIGGKVSFKLIEEARFHNDNQTVEIQFPDWWVQSCKHFIDLYGQEAGLRVFDKAMQRFTHPLFQMDEAEL